MSFEYCEANRISGFTLSISIPPSSGSTYSFVLDWERRNQPKALSSNGTNWKNNMNYSSTERTIKDNASRRSSECLITTDPSDIIKSKGFARIHEPPKHSKISKLVQKLPIEKEKQFIAQAYSTHDNLGIYKRHADNEINYSNLKDKTKVDENSNFINVKVIIRHHTEHGKTVEKIITDKVFHSSTLIDALRYLLRNTSIPLISSNYGRLFLLPDGKRNDKVRELPYDKNRYKMLAQFCSPGSGCTLLMDLTNTFLMKTIQ